MSINLYLAMTAAEFSSAEKLPPKIGWMACHFSCYGTNLTNLPTTLPEGSMVIINDCTPPNGHDEQKILQQLTGLAQQFSVSRFLLDFQRPGCEETASLANTLVQALPCPVAVSDIYGRDLCCPVFLPPPPLHTPLQKYLAPWKGREVWLDAAIGQETLTVTEKACQISEQTLPNGLEFPFEEEKLHCQYHTQIQSDRVIFTLNRDHKQLDGLLQEAESLGITTAVGLYQQLKAPG